MLKNVLLSVPFLMAMINIPFFPNTANITSFIICVALGFYGLILNKGV